MNRDVFTSLEASFRDLWNDLIGFLPELITAIIVVVVGWIIGSFLKGLTERGFKALNLTAILDKAGVDTLSERAGYRFKPAQFVGSLVKWFIILVFLVVALDILHLNEVTSFFTNEVLTYIPRVIVAAFILLGGMVVANLLADVVGGAARASGFRTADMIARFAKYSILVFAILAALSQLQIAPEMVQLLFGGMVFGVALAFGLAFGLGGRDTAARYLDRLTNDRSPRP